MPNSSSSLPPSKLPKSVLLGWGFDTLKIMHQDWVAAILAEATRPEPSDGEMLNGMHSLAATKLARELDKPIGTWVNPRTGATENKVMGVPRLEQPPIALFSIYQLLGLELPTVLQFHGNNHHVLRICVVRAYLSQSIHGLSLKKGTPLIFSWVFNGFELDREGAIGAPLAVPVTSTMYPDIEEHYPDGTYQRLKLDGHQNVQNVRAPRNPPIYEVTPDGYLRRNGKVLRKVAL